MTDTLTAPANPIAAESPELPHNPNLAPNLSSSLSNSLTNFKSNKKLYIKNYGCQMNSYDSRRVVELLTRRGYALTPQPADADLVVLNSCHIRAKADEKIYSDIGRLEKIIKPNSLITVMGCVAQAEGIEMQRRKPRIDIVVGTQNYHRLPELLEQHQQHTKRARPLNNRQNGGGYGNPHVTDTEFPKESKFDFLPDAETLVEPQLTGPHAVGISAFLAIQEGCDKFCSFCVVPYTRGAEFSRPAKAIFLEAKNLLTRGVKEITLLGQNVNAWHGLGTDGKEWNFARLLNYLSELPELIRLRYTTSHVLDVNKDLIAAHQFNKKLQPLLHLPLQSGSDRILKAMNRKHDFKTYQKTIDALRQAKPDLAFSSDFIVGFPEETDKDFALTLQAVQEIGFASSYSFCYSPRLGTPAYAMPQLPESVKKVRLLELQQLLNQQETKFNQTTLGKTIEVLFEQETASKPALTNDHSQPYPKYFSKQYRGRSPWAQPVHVNWVEPLATDAAKSSSISSSPIGKKLLVTITAVKNHSLFGEIVA